MIHPVSISTIPNKNKQIIHKQSAAKSVVPVQYSDFNTDYYEEEKIRLMKTGITVLGCIGTVIALTLGISGISKLIESSAKKSNSVKKASHTTVFSAAFENLEKNTKIPVLKNCKSLNKTLRSILQLEVDIKNSDKDVLEKSGARHINRLLLNGKPGTGKSFFAKVFAKTLGAEYMQVEYPDMNSKWAGEGVEKMDAIFKYIKETGQNNPNKLYVVTFNEIDAVFQPIETYSGTSHGGHMLTKMEQRATFLEYLERVSEEAPNVVIIGTTNLSPQKKGIDAAAVSRFQNVYEVPLPDKDNIYEALKMNLALLKDGDKFMASNDSNLRKLSEEMVNKKCSFRDLENVIERSTGYYLRDLMGDKNKIYSYEYLTKALSEHQVTDGMI